MEITWEKALEASKQMGPPLMYYDVNTKKESAPYWLVLNQSLSPMFLDMLGRVASQYGTAVLFTGIEPNCETPNSLKIVSGHRFDKTDFVSRARSWGSFIYGASGMLLSHSKPTFVLAVTNPPMLPNLAWISYRLQGNPYGLLFWDIYPEHLEQLGVIKKNGLLARIWRLANKSAMREAEVVITIGERMAETLYSQLGATKLKRPIEIIPNWSDTALIKPISRTNNNIVQSLGLGNRLVVQYSGNIGASHGLNGLVDAAELLADCEDIVFVIIGHGVGRSRIENRIASKRLKNVIVKDRMPWKSFPEVAAMADISVVVQAPGTEHLSIPSKTYTALSAGSMILALTSYDSDLSALVENENVGFTLGRDDAASIAKLLVRMAENRSALSEIKKRARKTAVENFDKHHATLQFGKVLGKYLKTTL